MKDKLMKIDTPEWMLEFFKSVDDLDTTENSGFRILANEVVMQFGPKTTQGIEEVKNFFIALDTPYITKHMVDEVFQYDSAYFMQGSALLRKKDDPEENTFQAAPLFNLFWFNQEGKVIRYVVDFPPEAAKSAGF